MIPVATARELRRLGVRWEPRPGDCFLVDQPEMADSVFWLSDFTIEVHEFGAERIVAFNGTTEWALDSVPIANCLWLPREDQLRELLASRLVRLERADAGWSVVCRVDGAELATPGSDVDTAYAQALLTALG